MADRVLSAKQGIDADALTPRDVNIQIPSQKPTDAAKVKAALASKVVQKEKDHPPPPPPMIYEPPSSDGKDGVAYQVGKMLGKGGFALCYEGHIPGNKRKYALKVVKSKMPSKMEQKVGLSIARRRCTEANGSAVPNRIADSLQNETPKYCSVPQSIFLRE